MATSEAGAKPTYEVRPAREEDAPAIVGIYNWAVNQTFATIDSEPLDVEEARSWWTQTARATVLVAVEDGGVIGWARLFPWSQRGFDIVEDLVYVDPVHQGRGIGRRLLGELIEQARLDGFRTIVSSVAADNRGGLELHRAFGFEEVGTIHDCAYKFDRWMDIVLLQRPLHAEPRG